MCSDVSLFFVSEVLRTAQTDLLAKTKDYRLSDYDSNLDLTPAASWCDKPPINPPVSKAVVKVNEHTCYVTFSKTKTVT